MSLTAIFETVLRFLADYTHSYAWAIIIVTIVIKALMHPLSVNQAKVMEQMKEIAPKQKELEEKYKGQPEEYQQRLAELYRDNKINPMAGCLPALIPLPILMIIYRVFLNQEFTKSLESAGVNVGFLWIENLAQPDPWIMPILSGVTTWISMNQASTDPSQKAMSFVMPIMFAWIARTLPAGAAIYWVATNIVSIIQQYIIKRQLAVSKKGVS